MGMCGSSVLRDDPFLGSSSGLSTRALCCNTCDVRVQSIDAAMAAEEKVCKLEEDDDMPTSVLHAARCTVQQQRGQVLVNVAKLRSVASALYAMSSRNIAGAGDRGSWAREWRHLENDLLAVATATTAARQAHIAGRAHRTYLVFRT
jgi:hypothetical protein